ncbi:Chitin synthase family-containing protein [Strongyloides ratti]|uniref:chitin synthase n=1 Tax=Strongyloides ratti TaxID=34506 RepID=A0A090LS42_STRRB|nr:Chitin synthase family-containing protein [Strongyloides ratti]CEF71032.1 Chitin synthase family-containing protein [Strongyloides ratti]
MAAYNRGESGYVDIDRRGENVSEHVYGVPQIHPTDYNNGDQYFNKYQFRKSSYEGHLAGEENISIASENKAWDIFRLLPPPADKKGKGFWHEMSLQGLKIATFFILFFLTLGSAVVAKSSFLLMTSAIGFAGKNMSICSDIIPEGSQTSVFISPKHVSKWIWAVLLSLCAPELLCFIRSFHRTLFRNVKRPTMLQFFVVLFIESIHAVGMGILVFYIFPEFPVEIGVMLSNALCLVPSILAVLSRKAYKLTMVLVIIDGCAIAIQSSGFWAWPVLVPEVGSKALLISVTLTMISLGWWQNFVHVNSMLPPMRSLAQFASKLTEKKSKTYVFVSLWKCGIYTLCMFMFLQSKMETKDIMQKDPFGEKIITITAYNMNETQIQKFHHRMENLIRDMDNFDAFSTNSDNNNNNNNIEDENDEIDNFDQEEVTTIKVTTTSKKDEEKKNNINIISDDGDDDLKESIKRFKRRVHINDKLKPEPEEEEEFTPYLIYDNFVQLNLYTSQYDALWVALIQISSVVIFYHSSKFACKVMMQRMGFALPTALSVPATVLLLSTTCKKRYENSCHMSNIIAKELFWKCQDEPVSAFDIDFWLQPQTWIWLCWLGSQIWVTIHLWNPKHERLAKTEKLFINSHLSAAFFDQTLALNRRSDDKAKIRTEDLELDGEDNNQTYETITGFGPPKPPPSVYSTSSSKLESGLIRETASAADAITKIYACATMWHESPLEMTCMLKSIFRLDEDQSARRNAQKYLKVIDPDYYEFEAHIFFDNAFDENDYGEPVLNKYVNQLIEKMDEAASAVHQTQMRLRVPKKTSTPYGGRITYTLPGKNRLLVHLKDKNKIRHRKRWSQVMYLYYLLGYRLMMKVEDQARKEVISENTFILTLDGDVDFTPQCVHLLVDLMRKNRRLGAACGRIHPRGSGLMIWYQKFEYAVGHWLQKATEHMIGCVLCSPGCFSLFRSYALMDDNVTRKYALKSENPLDYIQYDQGEDRWLCTLLLQRGYRVEYCAASDALTFAPEGFAEFFNQRRRWIPSTIANSFDLVKDYKNVVSVNESISIWYIIYQCIMLVSSILGPGSIFLMVVGAISISFNIDMTLALIVVAIPVGLFSIACLTLPQEKQLLLAEIIGCLFAMLMTAVIVGTSLQIQKDGIMSPHSIFLFFVIGSIATAAILHPLEFDCVIPGVLYFLSIPCMYLLLPIYSICNVNCVTWGTREDPVNKEKEEKESGLKGACTNICQMMCCYDPNKSENNPHLWKINETLQEITRKLDDIEKKSVGNNNNFSSRKDISKYNDNEEDEPAEEEDDKDLQRQSQAAMRNKKWKQTNDDTWLTAQSLRRAERESLETEEESFWHDVINKYLYPLAVDPKEQERVNKGLIDLRNRSVSGFFMLNVVFIIIVLVLQLQKDCLHIEWPFGPKYNHTITPCNTDTRKEIWVVTRLQLEPIGLVFLVFFMSILVIQFFAMLMHRFGTLAHIIASTELFCFRKPLDKLSEEDLVVQNAVEIARELQAIRGVDEVEQQPISEEKGISRRRVVQNLESSRKSVMKRKTETLDAAFKKRFFALSSDAAHDEPLGFSGREKRLTMRKGTIRALEQRRDSLFGTLDKRQERNLVSHLQDNEHGNNRGPAQRRLERLDRIFPQQDSSNNSQYHNERSANSTPSSYLQ